MTTEVSFGEPVTGSITGTFLGEDPGAISFVGSASWADTTATASIAEIATTSSITLGGVESASFASTASIVLGGIESASFAATAALAETASTAISAAFADNSILAQQATQSISASFGRMTGSFLGDAPASVSFQGSASFAVNTDSASFASGSGIIAEIAQAAPLAIPFFGGIDGKIQVTLGVTPNEIPDELTARTRVDLTSFNEARLSVRVFSTGDSTTGSIAVQYSLDAAEATWSFVNGFDGPKAFVTQSGTNADPEFTTIVSESRTDVALRLVGIDPDAKAPEVGMVVAYFRAVG